MFDGATAFIQTICSTDWVTSTASTTSMFTNSPGSIADTPCTCNPGQQLYGDKCTHCVPGQYQDEEAHAVTTCKDCGNGTFSYTSAKSCQPACPPGTTTGNDETCDPCPAGTYRGESETKCTDCTASAFSTAGQAKCDYTTDTCPAGTYPLDADKACAGCPAGLYSKVPIASVAGCVGKCPTGTYSDEKGLISDLQCKICGPGKYSDKKGTSSSCTLCPAGRYNYVKPDDIAY